MADNYTQFSTILDVGTKENVTKALAIAKTMPDPEGFEDLTFEVEADGGADTELWLHADEWFYTDYVVNYVTAVAKELKLKGKWGFAWANTCSKPRIDEFGGGAVVIDLETGHCKYFSAERWLEEQTNDPAAWSDADKAAA
jgi:hypothetical protein